ncbi:sodium bicarbonate transporter-like protein 11 [Aplysia californica]|uniref:Sodium bicarbonate transporter-like protein 11 n=1 Tax=Aplysia californica TaxID=6500 RepID=A0ABM1A9C3_APLCA|nr:sodium bicarbonate transporter-like protein 11 [Aplysia californica]
MNGDSTPGPGDDAAPESDVTFNLLPPASGADDDNGNVVVVKPRREHHVTGMPDEDEGTSLLQCTYERLTIKDFHAEVRAVRDIDFAISNSVVLLDVQANGLAHIVGEMLHALCTGQPEAKLDVTAARQAIFTSGVDSVVSHSIQGTVSSVDMGAVDYDQAWLCVMTELPSVAQKNVAFARLAHPVNLGPTCQEAQFVVLLLTPGKEKATKSVMELGRTFSSLFTDLTFRHKLLSATSKDGFRRMLKERAEQMQREQADPAFRKSSNQLAKSVFDEDDAKGGGPCSVIGRGLIGDLKRRLPHYLSDYKDGFIGERTPHKVTAAIFFLYFACVLPNLAFGMLNSNNTDGAIGVKKILFSQMFGGILFAVLGGQPLIVLLTTAPLALYTKIIFSISEDFDLDFRAMFACVGLWNAGFLILYSVFGVSKLMKWSSRSTEEIFSMFITFAFSADAIRDCIKDFNQNYHTDACHEDAITNSSLDSNNNSTFTTTVTTTTTVATTTTLASLAANLTNSTTTAATTAAAAAAATEPSVCSRESSVLFLLLMLCTVWVGLTLFNFTKTPYLTAGKREILADYALPIAVLFVSFFGSYIFGDVSLKPFEYNPDEGMFELAPLTLLPAGAVFAGAGLGFSLSLLFFMDQNISSALVNTPNNKLKKGAAYHWDLLVVALINGFLSIFSFPWVHAALPHSPLHVRALADHEERVEQGHVQQVVVHVRETRVSGILSHVLIGLSMLMLPTPLTYIPRAVLDGLFLYVAITALYGNQLFDRVLLLFTEQAAYPPNHYIRRVPQRKVHTFTAIQLVQLAVLCVFGFSPVSYMKMVFPVLLMFLMPIRHKLVPKVIEPKFLKALDGH